MKFTNFSRVLVVTPVALFNMESKYFNFLLQIRQKIQNLIDSVPIITEHNKKLLNDKWNGDGWKY